MTSITSNGTQLSILDPANGFFIGRFEIDNDGSGPRDDDPDHQDELSVRNPDGTFADASAVPFIALPRWIMRKFGPPVLGCRVQVLDLATMQLAEAAILDEAPESGYGEGSPALADCFRGVSDSPTTGGDGTREFLFRIYAGQGASVAGIQFIPQPLTTAA